MNDTMIINADTKQVTWMDLWDYIQEAVRNRIGAHDPFPASSPKVWRFHIYDGRRQVNICKKDETRGVYDSVANFVFEDFNLEGKPETVWIVKVENGRADYDGNYREPTGTPICGKGSMDWTSEVLDGSTILEVLRDTLIPWMSDNR